MIPCGRHRAGSLGRGKLFTGLEQRVCEEPRETELQPGRPGKLGWNAGRGVQTCLQWAGIGGFEHKDALEKRKKKKKMLQSALYIGGVQETEMLSSIQQEV